MRGFCFTMDIDPEDPERLRVKARCPKNTWFALMFGEKMGGSDMVRFICDGPATVTDMIGTSNWGMPREDGKENWEDS